MGLAKLYRATGDERYLKLAKFFIDVRGPRQKGTRPDYNQSNIKPSINAKRRGTPCARVIFTAAWRTSPP